MKRTLLIIGNDIRRRARSPLAVIVLLAIPLIMTALFGAIFGPRGGESRLPRIRVLVVDNDGSVASRMLLGALGHERMREMFHLIPAGADEAGAMMARGKASAMLVVPAGFGAGLLRAEEVALELVKNPSEQFLPEVVEELLGTLAVGVSGLVQVFEPELRAIDTLFTVDIREFQVGAMLPHLEAGREKIEYLSRFLDPLLLGLESEQQREEGAEARAQPNVFAWFLPGMAIMFLLFIVEIFMRDLLIERQDGRLRRMMYSPLGGGEVILARVFSGLLSGMAAFFVMAVFGSLVFSIDWGPLLPLLLLVATTCFWAAAFFGLLSSLFRSRNQAAAFTAPIILSFSLFGGSIVPVESIPSGLRWIGMLSVNYWFISASRGLREGIFPGTELGVIAISSALIFAAAVPAFGRRIRS